MMFVLRRTHLRFGYVANSGRKNSYTNNIKHARKFRTRGEAEEERCVDEVIMRIWTICPKCKEKVWFDCLDTQGVKEFREKGEICSYCQMFGKRGGGLSDSKGPSGEKEQKDLDKKEEVRCVRFKSEGVK